MSKPNTYFGLIEVQGLHFKAAVIFDPTEPVGSRWRVIGSESSLEILDRLINDSPEKESNSSGVEIKVSNDIALLSLGDLIDFTQKIWEKAKQEERGEPATKEELWDLFHRLDVAQANYLRPMYNAVKAALVGSD